MEVEHGMARAKISAELSHGIEGAEVFFDLCDGGRVLFVAFNVVVFGNRYGATSSGGR